MIQQSRLFLAAAAVSALFVTSSAKAQEAAPAEAVQMQAPATNAPAAPAPAPEYKKMGWGGIGFRAGFVTPSLKVDKVPLIQKKVDDTIASMNAVRGKVGAPLISKSDMDLAPGGVFELTPVLHLGGDGYFWKFEVPLTFGAEYKSVGLGIYPINYGYLIESIGLMPYLSLGGIVSYASATKAGGVDVNMSGAVIQTRVAVGVKYLLVSNLPVTLDIGYSPWAGGGMADTDKLNQFTNAQSQINNNDPAALATAQSLKDIKASQLVRGGVGSMFNVTFGIEWL